MEPAVRENPTDLSEASSDLTWSKMGMRSLYRECIDLCAFFTHVAEQTPVLLKDNAVRFIFDLDPTLGKIDTDPTRLLRIIENLLTNAITFTPTGEMLFMVRPVQRDDGRWVEIAVSDMGIGIPQESHLCIFDAFRQVEHGTLQHDNGVGLGLAICKQLVSVLSGEILVESAVGTGTTFRVLLPARRKTDHPRPKGSAGAARDANGAAVATASSAY